MAYTLGDIADKVRARVRDTAYASDEITNYVNDTINDIYNEYRLPFMQTIQTYTVTIGVSDITNGVLLPANYVQAINLTLTTASYEKVIPYYDFQQADEAYPDPDDTTLHPTSSSPDYWYFYGNTIRVFPAPKTAYALTLRYYKKPTALDDDADVPDVPAQYEEILVMGASYRVLQVKDNYDQAAILQNKYDEILDKLVARSVQPQVGRPIVITTSNRRHVGKMSF